MTAVAVIAFAMVASARAVPIDDVAPVSANVAIAVDRVDAGARQIVAAHPTIPVPPAVWPAALSLIVVAHRALRGPRRGAARLF